MIAICEYVRTKLVEDADVFGAVGNKIFPVVVPDSGDEDKPVNFPLIIITRVGLTPEYTKGLGCSMDTASVDVTCWTQSYTESVDIAKKIRSALELKKGEFGDIVVSNCILDSIEEGFVFESHSYYQSIIFNFK